MFIKIKQKNTKTLPAIDNLRIFNFRVTSVTKVDRRRLGIRRGCERLSFAWSCVQT